MTSVPSSSTDVDCDATCSDPDPAHRHGWNEKLCQRLERMAWGRALATYDRPRSRSGVVVLPVFAWDTPAASVGRKSRSRSGGKLALPIRVRWFIHQPKSKSHTPSAAEAMILSPDDSLTLKWEATGAGHRRSGITHVRASTRVLEGTFTFNATEPLVPSEVCVPVLSRVRARSRMQEVIEDGRKAQWEALTSIEEHLSWAFERAHAAVRYELLGDDNPAGLDTETKESIKDSLMFGSVTDQRPNRVKPESFAFRLLDRCLEVGTFTKVDPQKYVITTLVSGSETAIRRHIGDPHIGRKIRRLREERTWSSGDELVEAYRQRYPQDCLGLDRAEAALTADDAIPHVLSYDVLGDSFTPGGEDE